mgnify:FL=1
MKIFEAERKRKKKEFEDKICAEEVHIRLVVQLTPFIAKTEMNLFNLCSIFSSILQLESQVSKIVNRESKFANFSSDQNRQNISTGTSNYFPV